MPRLPRAIYALGWVSLLMDIASEMVYPLLPLFLTTVLGASKTTVGLVEGVAEATSSLFKVAGGRISDRIAARKPLLLAGYGAPAFSGLSWRWPRLPGTCFCTGSWIGSAKGCALPPVTPWSPRPPQKSSTGGPMGCTGRWTQQERPSGLCWQWCCCRWWATGGCSGSRLSQPYWR